MDVPKKVFTPGEFIFFEGDLDKDFYIIEKGQVEIFTKDAQGKKVVLAQLGPGSVFGEMALLLNEPRSATAQAVVMTEVQVISEEIYAHLLQELPDWVKGFIQNLLEKVLLQNEKVRQLQLELRHCRQQLTQK